MHKKYSDQELDVFLDKINKGAFDAIRSDNHPVVQVPERVGMKDATGEHISIPYQNGKGRRVFKKKTDGTWEEIPIMGGPSEFI